MLLKWIICEVEPGQRDDFSQAQLAWRRLARVPGFLGQLGGWNRASTGEAVILALWEGEAAYADFMATRHDPIVAASGQERTYARLATSLWAHALPMPPRRGPLVEAARRGAVLLRSAECRLRPGRRDHFLEAQRDVWTPAMASTGSVLGGVVGESAAGDDAFLVVTLWDSEAAHDAYVDGLLPALRRRTEVSGDIDSMTGRIVALVPEWTIAPEYTT